MNDHVHLLVQPKPEWRLEQLVHSWKCFSARALQRERGRTGSIWQDEYFDRIVRDDDELAEKLAYILHNPVKRWPSLGEYPWANASGEE
jgi:REP element-mobilizing transposase RayT